MRASKSAGDNGTTGTLNATLGKPKRSTPVVYSIDGRVVNPLLIPRRERPKSGIVKALTVPSRGPIVKTSDVGCRSAPQKPAGKGGSRTQFLGRPASSASGKRHSKESPSSSIVQPLLRSDVESSTSSGMKPVLTDNVAELGAAAYRQEKEFKNNQNFQAHRPKFESSLL